MFSPEWTALKLINVDENRVSRSERFVQLNKNEYFKVDTLDLLVGKSALAAQVFDGMEGNNNRNGVYQLKMYVDGKLHFHFLAGKIDLEESKYANALIDFKENKLSKDIFIDVTVFREIILNLLNIFRMMDISM